MIYRSEDGADQRGDHHQNTQFIWEPISVPYTIDFYPIVGGGNILF